MLESMASVLTFTMRRTAWRRQRLCCTVILITFSRKTDLKQVLFIEGERNAEKGKVEKRLEGAEADDSKKPGARLATVVMEDKQAKNRKQPGQKCKVNGPRSFCYQKL